MRNLGSAITLALSLAAITNSSARADTIFNFSGAMVTYTIPTTGVYYIVAAGAQGGTNTDDGVGGLGAIMSGHAFLIAGTVLDIVVGGDPLPLSDLSDGGGGGGGGTFVFEPFAIQPLIVAGGGGGGPEYPFAVGGSGQTGMNGEDAVGGGAGGVGGYGGGGGGPIVGLTAGGGAGWFGNGGDGIAGCNPVPPFNCVPSPDSGGFGPPTFAGGKGDEDNGGFGGGGGDGYNGAGGGGGYSGGGGGGNDYLDAGGGGGSYIDPWFSGTTRLGGTNEGNGYVTIGEVPAPEPGSVILLLMGIAGLGLLARQSER